MNYPGVKIFLKLIFFVFASWMLVHVIGFLGIFLALAYPIWWAFAPRNVPCIYCQTRHEGQWCPLCKRKVDKSTGTYPETFKSVALNAFIILTMSIISLGLIFVESKIISLFGVVPTEKTASFVIPDRGEYKVGEIYPMEIKIAGIKEAINAVQADIKFDQNIIEVVELSTENSFANIFVQKDFNNELGYLRLSGGLPNPGFDEDAGVFGTVYFRGKVPGAVNVTFLPSSLVLANDGKGTNVLKDLASVSYLIKPANPDDIFPDREVTITPQVLGEDAETKLLLETNPDVLGLKISTSSAEVAEPKEEESNLVVKFLAFIHKIDSAILNIWARFNPFF